MTGPSDGPPDEITYDLEAALELLAALEDARDVLAESDHVAVLAQIEHQVVELSRKLHFDETEGDQNGR
jgi:hypothetical protein